MPCIDMNWKEILKEYKEKGREDSLTKGRVIALEQAWFKDNAKKCDKCPRTEWLTLDHIVPKDTLFDFGIEPSKTFDDENLRILCKPCNTFKGNRLDFSTPETKKLLLKYLDKL